MEREGGCVSSRIPACRAARKRRAAMEEDEPELAAGLEAALELAPAVQAAIEQVCRGAGREAGRLAWVPGRGEVPSGEGPGVGAARCPLCEGPGGLPQRAPGFPLLGPGKPQAGRAWEEGAAPPSVGGEPLGPREGTGRALPVSWGCAGPGPPGPVNAGGLAPSPAVRGVVLVVGLS